MSCATVHSLSSALAVHHGLLLYDVFGAAHAHLTLSLHHVATQGTSTISAAG